MFRHLVVSQLFSPGSKLKTIDYLERYQGIRYSKDTVCCLLDRLCVKNGSIKRTRHQASGRANQFLSHKKVLKGKVRVMFYDMTTLYFAQTRIISQDGLFEGWQTSVSVNFSRPAGRCRRQSDRL